MSSNDFTEKNGMNTNESKKTPVIPTKAGKEFFGSLDFWIKT